MNFADVYAGVADFKHAVNTQVEQNAFKDVGTRGPTGTADEAGFLRLVAWSYAFIYERGRVVIPYLLRLPGQDHAAAQEHARTRKVVQMLRTWLFHSLDADSDRDLEIGRAASQWFLAQSKTTSPQKSTDWNKAFTELCVQVVGVATHCTALISDIAGDPERAELQFGALRLRIKRDWQAFEYDQFVEDAAARLGERISAKAFRERRIDDWRRFVATLPEDADLRFEMQRVIEAEVLAHFRTRLPLTSEELMGLFRLAPGKDVLIGLEMIRHLTSLGMNERDVLIAHLSDALNKGPLNAS